MGIVKLEVKLTKFIMKSAFSFLLVILSIYGIYAQVNSTEVATITSTTIAAKREIKIGEFFREFPFIG